MYAVIDIGSNTLRMVLYKVENEEIISVLNKKAAIGLASYINEDQKLRNTGIQKLIESLKMFQEILDYVKYDKLYIFATASLRNIKNTEEVLKEIKVATSLDVEVLSGEDEATLDFYGAKTQMPYEEGFMADIGGGSTELAFFDKTGLKSVVSLPIGSLNLYTNHVDGILPSEKEMKEIRKITRKTLEESAPKSGEFATKYLVSVGGTARAAYSYIQSKKKIEVLGTEYPKTHLDVLINAAQGKVKKFTKKVLKVAPDRIHTFTPGLVMFHEIAEYYDVELIVSSQYGVREGYLHQKLSQEGKLS